MSKRKQNVLQWFFNKSNSAGDQANLYDIMYSYETISNATEAEQEAIMDYVVSRMGLASYEILTNEKMQLLLNNGWLDKEEYSLEDQEPAEQVTLYAFDCEGTKIVSDFENEEQAEIFAENHGLEVFKIERTADQRKKVNELPFPLWKLNQEQQEQEIEYQEWQQLIKDLNQGQPDLMQLVQNQIDQHEKEKGE